MSKQDDRDNNAARIIEEQIRRSIVQPGPEPAQPRHNTPADAERYRQDSARDLEDRRRRHG